VIVPRFSSLLSAYGIACADLTEEAALPLMREVQDNFADSTAYTEVQDRISQLKMIVLKKLLEQGVTAEDVLYTETVSLHYDGADSIFRLPITSDLKADFVAAHLSETSFKMSRRVMISGVRVQGTGQSFKVAPEDYAPELARIEALPRNSSHSASSRQAATFEVNGKVQTIDTPVYILSSIPLGETVLGPAIIVDSTQTIVVEPISRAIVLKEHVIIRVEKENTLGQDNGAIVTDPVLLAVFANRFMTIAEQMGHTLQRTSISVSIKERLDFSCSIHGTDGGEY
jgi:5-oxoprolinase (ATP-hydrolysing)